MVIDWINSGIVKAHIVVIVIVVVGHAHHTFDLIEHTHL